MKLKFVLVLILLLCFTFIYAQQGTIRGQIKDVASQEGLPFATVQVQGTTNGTVTDFDGNYTLSLEPGTYPIEISFIGYVTIQITDVSVESGEVMILNASLEEETEMLEAVVVTAEQINNTESAILNVQRKSANLLDGISAQNFKKIGDNNAAGAIRRVPGVSVDGGKYVYVRGLGDRYTKSILNGVDIPGLDPDRNTIQMDIFPTNLIDNILVVKTSTADLPADFTGGVVNIVTKDFPDAREWSVSASVGYNPDMHFTDDYLTYPGGNTDFLGIDDGTRDLPINKKTTIPNPVFDDPATTDLTREFNPQLQAENQRSFMNFSLGLTGGDQKQLANGKTIGYIAALGYRNTTTFIRDNINTSYFKNEDTSVDDLRLNRIQRGDFGNHNVLFSGLGGVTLRSKRSKYSLNLMHLQNGESRAGYFFQRSIVENSVDLFKDNLEYNERSITNVMLSGEHSNENGDFKVEWKVSPTRSNMEDKDIRLTPYRIDGTNYTIEPSESGAPTRIWRNLDEVNLVARTDFTKKLQLFGYESNLKFGAYSVVKSRDYEILNYRMAVNGISQFTGEANELFSDEFLWTPSSGVGSYIQGNFEPSNTFEATQLNVAGYVSSEFRPTANFRTILGLRVENFDQWYSGIDQSGNDFDNEQILDMTHLFPSANFIYNLTERSNLRLSYSRTIARPSFKEASYAQIFDPLTGRTFIGGLRRAQTLVDGQFQTIWDGNLRETKIDNFDLRWEAFQERAQMFAVSAFFKNFTDPIELVVFSDNAPDNFQPRNVGNAIVYGTELEMRKDLSFVSPGLDVLSFNVNTTLLRSIEEMDTRPNGEFDSRVDNARDGENVKNTRQLQGQAPYMINAGVSYNGRNDGIQAGFFYNVQGRRLEIVGFGASPDVFTEPFHSLNFNMSKTFGINRNQKVGFGVNNILGDDLESRYDAFRTDNPIFSRVSPERRFTLRYSLSF